MAKLRVVSLFLALVLGLGLLSPAYAWWPLDWIAGKDEDEKQYLPPPADAIRQECEPLRLKIKELNAKGKVVHPFFRPRIGMLKRKYQNCTDKYHKQEYNYLKKAEIKIPQPTPIPNLPPLHEEESPDGIQPLPGLQ